MPSPERLAHVVFQTNDVPRLRDWWLNVLEAKVQYGNDRICFLAYDDEHHRLALANLADGYKPHDPDTLGMHHVAFTYATLADLIATYERLRDEDITPWWQIHHGPTLSLYYRDPDGNQAEMQVDVYETVDEANEFMFGPEFAANPIGIEFDMEDLIARRKAGESDSELIKRPTTTATS
ncbi:VOC family protein [Rhodococcus sp. B50]|uniref:VOC family protein n=1 Tax=Rhodococcus sp. B50 TaxID=2682847 RepID=UPI001BD355CD|nr:VOC family protein [Rhodococcus sp. B50]MBS9376567.1 Biphenyl-2,3-diol 1,2-dioxygenase 2 [Rhodococcus sp. B50]